MLDTAPADGPEAYAGIVNPGERHVNFDAWAVGHSNLVAAPLFLYCAAALAFMPLARRIGKGPLALSVCM